MYVAMYVRDILCFFSNSVECSLPIVERDWLKVKGDKEMMEHVSQRRGDRDNELVLTGKIKF